MKIKLFSNASIEDIENTLNSWVEDNLEIINIIDVKLSSTLNSFDVMVMYKDKLCTEKFQSEAIVKDIVPAPKDGTAKKSLNKTVFDKIKESSLGELVELLECNLYIVHEWNKSFTSEEKYVKRREWLLKDAKILKTDEDLGPEWNYH